MYIDVVSIRLNLLEAEDSNRAKEKRLLELNLKIKEEELAVKEECAVSLEKELHCLRAKYKESEVQSMCMKELKYVFYLPWYGMHISRLV